MWFCLDLLYKVLLNILLSCSMRIKFLHKVPTVLANTSPWSYLPLAPSPQYHCTDLVLVISFSHRKCSYLSSPLAPSEVKAHQYTSSRKPALISSARKNYYFLPGLKLPRFLFHILLSLGSLHLLFVLPLFLCMAEFVSFKDWVWYSHLHHVAQRY